MSKKFTILESGEIVPVFCTNCKNDLRFVGISNHFFMILDYTYNEKEQEFKEPEIADHMDEKYYCGECRYPVLVNNGFIDCSNVCPVLSHNHEEAYKKNGCV